MAHFIQALIARLQTANAFCNRHEGTMACPLPQDFGIVPIESEMVQEWTNCAEAPDDDTFFILNDEFIIFLKQESKHGRIAYVETEYFGDEGAEGAIVVDNGKIIMRPVWQHDAILEAVRLLGVQPDNEVQMFRFANEEVVLGIGSFRSNDDIVAAAKGQDGS